MQDWERLYFDDFDVWCERQIEALNRHKENLSADLDAERIAEEWQLMQRRERLDEFATPSLDPKLAAMLPEMYERAREPAKCELHDIGQIESWLVLGRAAGGRRLITGRVQPSA